jgi:predicted flap endonuclease-1-like 5' DNA nuclease
VLSLLHHNIPVASVTTDPIQVLSYRLYHAPKVSFDQLKPDDSVSKMKGIGSQYAKRFQALGIEKVSQLAALDLSTLSELDTRNLLGNLRKDRGTMTLAKLTEYIQQAAEIVSRYPHSPSMSSPTHTVARRAFAPQVATATPLEASTTELRNSIIARVMLNLESMART